MHVSYGFPRMTMVLLVHEKKLLKTCFLIYEILGNVGGYLLGEVLCIDMKCLEIFEGDQSLFVDILIWCTYTMINLYL